MRLELRLFGHQVLALSTGDPEPGTGDMRGSVTTEALDAEATTPPRLGFVPPSLSED